MSRKKNKQQYFLIYYKILTTVYFNKWRGELSTHLKAWQLHQSTIHLHNKSTWTPRGSYEQCDKQHWSNSVQQSQQIQTGTDMKPQTNKTRNKDSNINATVFYCALIILMMTKRTMSATHTSLKKIFTWNNKRFRGVTTKQQHCTVPQQPDEIRKLGRGMAGQLHVVWGLTGASSYTTKP